jgi:hypothetical protein
MTVSCLSFISSYRADTVNPVEEGWFAAGKVLRLALDLGTGSLLIAVASPVQHEEQEQAGKKVYDEGEWKAAFPDGLCPGPAVGAALYPALSGSKGARVRCHFGGSGAAGMPVGKGPTDEYRAVGDAAQVMSCSTASIFHLQIRP